MNRNSRGWLGALGSALLMTSAACSLLLDHSTTQCQSDGDCAKYGGHPYCRSGLCVSSGLGPADCFAGVPQQPANFLNQCSSAQCLSFDNCKRLDLCGDASDLGAPLLSPPPPEAAPPSVASEAGAASSPAAGALGAEDAGAMPSCVDPASGRAQVITMTGSSNFPPLLAKLAPLILATGYTPVYQVTSSCTGVSSVFGAQSSHLITDPAPGTTGKYAAYFQADGTSVPCSLGPSGAAVDVGESDIFSTTCDATNVAGGAVGEYLGPIQAMIFVVPGKSQQTAISAEAARNVFGRGGSNASPWTDPSLYFVRNSATGTQQMIGHAIGVPASSFWGIDRSTAANVDALLRVISEDNVAQEAIGIISADYYDADRANVKALAFKATDQDCAYLPDSTEFSKDKRNVRDGHYVIWGPVHFFARVSAGVPVSAGAQAFVSVVSVPNVPQTLLDAFIGASLVPSCAMSVQRTSELGALSTYSAPFQCGCYFEASPSTNGAAPAGCARCTTAADCQDPARPACNLGYCEVR